ncbi:MAG: exonuclease domain-containing protein [Lutibacter sp.]
MKLNLKRPIVFFDLETTGVNIGKDRIVEIAILKVFPNGNKESKSWLVNPGIKIPKEVSDIHGITDETVANEPRFKEIAPEISKLIDGCDLAGFNSNRFDIPLLAEEMIRAKVNFEMTGRKAIDVQTIFHKKEERTLSAGYKFYCKKDLNDAHSAMADTKATFEVLEAQLDKYDDLENNIDFLSEYSTHSKRADFAGFILYNDNNEEIFTFGKYKGQTVEEVLNKDKGYFSWIQQAEFPLYTKRVLKNIRERVIKNRPEPTIEDLKNKFNQKL